MPPEGAGVPPTTSPHARRNVTLVIPAWNSWSLTARMLASLRASDLTDATVIVVDNGSSDETAGGLAERGDWLRIVRLPENVGFVRGCNTGIALADPESDIVLLNTDLILEQRDWLQRLRDCAAANPDIGIVGCRLVNEEGLLVHTGTVVLPDTCWGQQVEWGVQKDVGQFTRDRRVQGVVFAVAYIKRETIRAIGALDLAFDTYFEDTDYCLRAREAGLGTMLCGGVTVIHTGHGSTLLSHKFRERLFLSGQAVFAARWKAALEKAYDREVLWQSAINAPGPYAVSSRALIRGLDAAGVRVFYDYAGEPPPEAEDSGIYFLNVIRARRSPRAAAVSVVHAAADQFEKARGRVRVGYAAILESLSDRALAAAREMDEIWVPSAFDGDRLRGADVSVPLTVMPLGFDPDQFHPRTPGYRSPHGEYVFLACVHWNPEDPPAELLQTFSRTFSAQELARLVMTINTGARQTDVAPQIARLGLAETGGRISYLINRRFPLYQRGSLFRSADCYVAAGTQGRWDARLMQAMACGLPAIAADHGANREFIHAGITYPLRVKPAPLPAAGTAAMMRPDTEHLAYLLRQAYENREAAAAMGMAAAREMLESWTWERAVARIRDRLDAVA